MSATPRASPPAGKATGIMIDAHIHLYPACEQHTLAWWTPGHALSGQHSLDEYAAATARGPAAVAGFVFVETDRIHDLAAGPLGWQFPLMEVSWVSRVVAEARSASQRRAIVPWAPLPAGCDTLQHYVSRVRDCAADSWPEVRGFRYLVQQKPRGLMLQDGFIDGLRWLGKERFTFDHGIDTHRDGLEWIDDTVEMIRRAHEGVPDKEKVTFIIDHLCKPDMTLFVSSSRADVTTHPTFQSWRAGISSLSRCAKTYMKLSGCLTETPPKFASSAGDDPSAASRTIFAALQPWLAVVLTTFGPSRMMFASDWPVCTLGVRSERGVHQAEEVLGMKKRDGAAAWEIWRLVVERMCDTANLSIEDRAKLWGGTAIEAYGIEGAPED